MLASPAQSDRPLRARRQWLRAATRIGVGTAALGLGACAALGPADPLRVNVVGLQTLSGEGLELRFVVKLRVQNPAETALEYDGLSLELDLRGMSFASGVSSERGTVPRFGEAVLAVPVTVSATALLRQGLSLLQQQGEITRIPYRLRGRMGGSPLGSRRFDSDGQLDWPPVPAQAAGTRPAA